MRGIAFKCCPIFFYLHPLLSSFFLTVSLLKLTLLDECSGDHGGERYGDEFLR